MRTLLFDIDGTLIRTHGAGKAAMEAALRRAFGITHVNDTVPYSGRTDRAIGRDLLTVHGLEPSAENVSRLTETYLSELPAQLTRLGGEVCPGVNAILDVVRGRSDVLVGLLTGNVRRGATTKLTHFGLWDFFPFGGFGDDHFDRDDVARAALAAAHRHHGQPVDPQSVWIIGDSPLDISCARAVGANVIAVATGWHTLTDLGTHKPDLLLSDLGDGSEVLKVWGLQ